MKKLFLSLLIVLLSGCAFTQKPLAVDHSKGYNAVKEDPIKKTLDSVPSFLDRIIAVPLF